MAHQDLVNFRKGRLTVLLQEDGWEQKLFTAYNVGNPNQTDDTPCIGAANVDLCELVDKGHCVLAANAYPLGTTLYVYELETECTVLDRTAQKYHNRIDLAFPKDKYNEAIEFGKQTLWVKVIK